MEKWIVTGAENWIPRGMTEAAGEYDESSIKKTAKKKIDIS